MRSIQTIALVAVLGMASATGFAAGAPEVVAKDGDKAETKIEYVADMTGVT